MSWYQRIKYFNLPTAPDEYQRLMKGVERFLQIDNQRIHCHHITFIGVSGKLTDAEILVLLPDPVEKKYTTIGKFTLGEIHRYQDMYGRISESNVVGDPSVESNLLYNGLFNLGSNGLEGWEIEQKAETTVVIVENGILKCTDPTESGVSVILLNKKTVLQPLISYRVNSLINNIQVGANVKYRIGTQNGSTHTTIGPTSEVIASTGSQFRIIVSLEGAGLNVAIPHIILYKE